MPLFAELQQELQTYLDASQLELIERAYNLANEAHTNQFRQTGEPYITHPLAVAYILATMRMDYQSIMAALLHDVIEDTAINKEMLGQKFGEEVAELVDGVSKLKHIYFESRAERQAENFRKMVLAMVRDIRVILIKLADRLHNMRTIEALPPPKRRRIAKETLEIYAPIANRLGMHNFYTELEDLSFCALYPLRFRILKEAIRKARKNRRHIISSIETAIKDRLEKNEIPPSAVWGREKHIYSIYRKMHEKHLPFSEIMDFYGFRIVVDKIDTCYRVLGVIHNLYKPVPERFKDYIAIPKSNGYQSLHTTLFGPHGVPIEVQIRTVDMNYIADNGIAAHWLYKTKSSMISETELRAQEWLKGLIQIQQTAGTSLEFIENVKIDLFPDEVYVFTPKGMILELPMGATPVDFAYAIHSDIGDSCVAAKIDRRLSPLSTPLANGQTIEIITAKGAKPNPSWLNFVTTGKARAGIRNYLKGQRRAEAVALGKELLDKTLYDFSAVMADITPELLQRELELHNYKSLDELYEGLGLGNQVPQVVASRLLGLIETEHDEIPPSKQNEPLLIKGCEGMVVQFAECCRPLPGDPIIGFITRGQGLVIHTETCPVVTKLQTHPSRCTEVAWSKQVIHDFKADVFLQVANQRGVLGLLANTIADSDSNIENVSVQHGDGQYSVVNLLLSVKDRKHLANIMRKLRKLESVNKISRHRF